MLFFTKEKIERLLRDIKDTIYRETYPITRFKFAKLNGMDETTEQHLHVLMRKVLSSKPSNRLRRSLQ
jgi:hypothetical protein